MASVWTEEETFVCSVCLDTLKDPATLPCGHSYCLACIHSHWDKRNSTGQYSCPQCRQIFNPRPSLSKSTVLVEVMEKLRTNSLKQTCSTVASSAPPSMPIYLDILPNTGLPLQGSMHPQHPTVDPRLCTHHNQPLDMFCHEDKECVCVVCCQDGHRGHHVLRPQEERKERQKELMQMQTEVQRRIQETDRKLKEFPNTARQYKALVQALGQESTDLFSDLAKKLNIAGIQVVELLSSHETFLGSKVEGQIHRLEQEAAQLRWKSEELSRLANMQDHICFLKNFLTMEPLDPTSATGESVMSQEEAVVASIRLVMKELQTSVEDQCKASLAKIMKFVKPDNLTSPPSGAVIDLSLAGTCVQAGAQNTGSLLKYPALYSTSPQTSAPPPPLLPSCPQPPPVNMVGHINPEPKSREELLKFRFEPTMDPNTVYRHLQLSDGGHKATLRTENLNPPDHPERFHFWRQVLCREPLAGSPYYWEVEWTGQKLLGVMGVTFNLKKKKLNGFLHYNYCIC